jgi:predicted glutamine amidotransferase
MCRLYGFRSSVDSHVHRSLVAAENALAVQSRRHKDGWGIAYYIDRFPHLIRNDRQAIGDTLFREVSGVVATKTFLAHIRKATVGTISVLNCHPFQHGAWSWAHNGEIAGFAADPTVRERALSLVDQRFRRFILGGTDSEVCFYLFLSHLNRLVDDIHNRGVGTRRVVDALRSTIEQLTAMDAGDGSLLTFLVTNGEVMLGYRRGRELFYSTHKSRCAERDTCPAFEAERCEREPNDGIVKHLILASEMPDEGPNVWQELAEDGYVAVGHGMNLTRGVLNGS